MAICKFCEREMPYSGGMRIPRHEPWECIENLRAENERLREAWQDALRTLGEAWEIESDRRQSIRMLRKLTTLWRVCLSERNGT